jgi:hypothetical protein
MTGLLNGTPTLDEPIALVDDRILTSCAVFRARMDGWWTLAAGTAALNDRLLKGAWDRDRHATLLPGNPFSWIDHLIRPQQQRLLNGQRPALLCTRLT